MSRQKRSYQAKVMSQNILAEQIVQVFAHEIRGLVSALSLQLALIERDPERAMKAGFIKKARDQVEALTRFIRRILTIHGSPDIAPTLEIEEVELSKLIQNSCSLMKESIERRGCTLSIQVEDGIIVSCDSIRVQQLPFNLIDNAVKFSGGGEVFVRLYRRTMDQAVLLEVEDSGRGIPQESLKTIFKKFSRGKNSRTVPGLGLGLHVCARIVQAHGWEIGVLNSHMGGAVFKIQLSSH
ncbi:MAG: HAMP domain-containing histidine kinase [Bdellovibrionales bacterium]|nr:HAMP domain-containing histidine kinase [Bdellovibrionales bacterium]